MRVKLGSLGLPELAAAVERALMRVPPFELVPVVANATADTPFIVAHSLGVKPQAFFWMAESDVTCYRTAADFSEWDNRQIKVRCTGARAPLIVMVVG